MADAVITLVSHAEGGAVKKSTAIVVDITTVDGVDFSQTLFTVSIDGNPEVVFTGAAMWLLSGWEQTLIEAITNGWRFSIIPSLVVTWRDSQTISVDVQSASLIQVGVTETTFNLVAEARPIDVRIFNMILSQIRTIDKS